MNGLLFFTTIFCGIFGAYIFIELVYDWIINVLKKGRSKHAASNGRIHNDKRNG